MRGLNPLNPDWHVAGWVAVALFLTTFLLISLFPDMIQ